ncbi:NAD(P)H-binding protein [Streptomyces sp. NPDC059850]|uniref:NAD(P)H-binding protein n=1 Tax=Streptomyces sp. NPDC059850 TaxID=3346970 RepID=UPI0036524076
MAILVTGATGNVGRNVVRQLVEAKEEVRALTRSRHPVGIPDAVRAVTGDLMRPESLTDALKGVDRMFLFPVAETAREVVDLARQAGVRRIVVLSSGAVTAGFDSDFHLPVERAVEESGLEWTHVRPGEFAMNKLALWGPSIRAEGVVREPHPDAAWYPVHERDIADVAILALLEDGHRGRAYTLNGPEMLSHRRQVELIAEAIGRPIRFDVVSREEAREIYREQGGFAAASADFLLGIEDYSGGETDPQAFEEFDDAAAGPVPTAEEATGVPARTFAQWAHDHARDFLPD